MTSKKWIKIIFSIGALAITWAAGTYINYQRTTVGEVYAQSLHEKRNDIVSSASNMKNKTSYAEFVVSPESIDNLKSGEGFKSLEALPFKVYCELNITQAQKLEVTHFHANVYTDKHDLIISRIFTPNDCT